MKALLYMSKRTFVNKFKKALRRPVTYLYIVLGVLYAGFILSALGGLFMKIRFNSAWGLVILITVWTIYIYGTDFVSHAKRKGILFKQSHAHLIFTAPVNPKLVLLYAAGKNFLMSFIMSVLLTVGGATVFQLSFIQVILFFILSFVVTVILEGSQIVLIYANERFSEKQIKVLSKLVYGILLAFAVFVIWYFRKYGFSIGSAMEIAKAPILQMIPLLGWNIAAYHLILLGPTTLNVVCTVLYLLSVGIICFAAVKQKCVGEYYEDAAKFADDYAEFRTKNKQGDTTYSIGKRRTFKKVKDNYQAVGAKAIFYRQLLEYKKERWFIFGKMTLVGVFIAAALIMYIGRPDKAPEDLFLLGLAAYMVLLTSGYMGKWEKELKNPYLFLIPDSPLRKMWYATLMEHFRAGIDGLAFILPVGIAWKIEPWKILLIWLIYIVLQANKLYLRVFSDAVLGETLGLTGKRIMRMFIQSALLGIGVLIAVVVGAMAGTGIVFPIVLVYSIAATVLIALLAVTRFERMEQAD